MERTLKPAIRLRWVEPKVCGTCRHGNFDNGSFVCRRPGVPVLDTGSGHHWYRTCDLWTKQKKDQEI